jgi:tyrosyl-tRNA synthetase
VDLAKFLIARFHSAESAKQAEEEFNRMFVDKGLPDEIPEFVVAASAEPMWICHLLQQSGLAPSTSEARRLIVGRAVEIDQVKIEDDKLKIELKIGRTFILKAGKRKFAKVIVK